MIERDGPVLELADFIEATSDVFEQQYPNPVSVVDDSGAGELSA
jgi:hypothetical protein